mmetsp:Transcript_12206/g.22535  ORF Transcript_12206/g.22535 Transcript_12206/m.22535 type:complete len:740 (+) Transcript_12206:70-2289(+)
MSARLATRFAECRSAGRTAFVGYITAGYPKKADTVPAMFEMEKNGADVIELGVPFSDPMADGSAIEAASVVAIANGTIYSDVLAYAKEARGKGLKVPILLMGYYNSFLAAGVEETCKECASIGIDGFIIVDLPCEEAWRAMGPAATANGLNLVPLAAPTSDPERLKHVVDCALYPTPGMVYVVSLLGVTGVRDKEAKDAKAIRMAECKGVVEKVKAAAKAAAPGVELPVVVGFGISERSHVEEFGQFADGCVVGTKIVVEAGKGGVPAVGEVVKKLSGGPLTNGHANGATPPPAKRQRTDGGEDRSKHADKWNFGGTIFGGRFIPETLMVAHQELEDAWNKWKADPEFRAELRTLRKDFIGGPTPIYHAKRLSAHCGGADIWFKREELAHTGAHKINNAIGQALLAMKLGKKRIIAETGAGQHGVATAAACALLDLECIVYMGEIDCERQKLNCFRMAELGATVVPVKSGSRTLKDAVNEALRDWVTNIRTTHYIIGSAVGPHPFPDIVRDLQSVIGNEARAQMLNQTQGEMGHPTFTNGPGRLPDYVVACVGGGSNAIGMFSAFLEDKDVKIIGVEAGGEHGPVMPDGTATDKHSATLTAGTVGVLHGSRTYLLQSPDGQIKETHSISAGLDYPGVGPQHAQLKACGRVEYRFATDNQALDAMRLVSRKEGIVPALEPSHAAHITMELAKSLPKGKIVLLNLCGRGDKDMLHVAKARGVTIETNVLLTKTDVTEGEKK